jgi:hypothetical protein
MYELIALPVELAPPVGTTTISVLVGATVSVVVADSVSSTEEDDEEDSGSDVEEGTYVVTVVSPAVVTDVAVG